MSSCHHAAEVIPESIQAELAHALGRVLVWMIDCGTAEGIGERVTVAAYKLRPDLIGGATLAEIAKHRGMRRSWTNKLSRQFTRTFGIRGLNSHTLRTARPADAALARAHGVCESHLKLINRFVEWRTFFDEGGSAIPETLEGRLAMKRDFEPIARFIAELENRHSVDKQPKVETSSK